MQLAASHTVLPPCEQIVERVNVWCKAEDDPSDGAPKNNSVTHRPCPDEALKIWPVDKMVGNVRSNGPQLILPVQPLHKSRADETLCRLGRRGVR